MLIAGMCIQIVQRNMDLAIKFLSILPNRNAKTITLYILYDAYAASTMQEYVVLLFLKFVLDKEYKL